MTIEMKEKYNKILKNALDFERDEKIRVIIKDYENDIAKIDDSYYYRDDQESEGDDDSYEAADSCEMEIDEAISLAQKTILMYIQDYEDRFNKYKLI